MKILRQINLTDGGKIVLCWVGSRVHVHEITAPPERAEKFVGAAYNPDDASEIADRAALGRT